MAHAISTASLRSDHMSPSALALAVLLHALVVLALWWMSLNPRQPGRKIRRQEQADETCIVAARQIGEPDPLALLHERELQKGNANRATLAVARKMVSYLLAVDRRGTDFISSEERSTAAA